METRFFLFGRNIKSGKNIMYNAKQNELPGFTMQK